ncbi:virulence RhuM family protein [Candidatus Woesearchaeota archaeon]|nr:virulence RhuM family protein [Candidatus Woesearchaeota archaeon]
MVKDVTIKDRITDFLIYTTPEGDVKIEAFLHNENIWLTQKKMAELFSVGIPAISKHLENIYSEGELYSNSTVSKMEIVQKEGDRDVKRTVEFYNLDVIISVGYRVNSKQATLFRIWATKVLKEYILKGFAMDDNRLKNGKYFGKDYFDELLERVRSIRSSERRIYQKITDIFVECSIDYDPKSEITKEFYAAVQNKFHYAISGQTAAELIFSKADATKKNMGLSTWKNAPKGRILKSDSIIAKNYLDINKIKKLERIVSSFFDYIERIIENRTVMKMENLAESVNKFLEFNEFKVLEGKGQISFKDAENKAFKEYDEFNQHQQLDSDFDKFSRNLLEDKKNEAKNPL